MTEFKGWRTKEFYSGAKSAHRRAVYKAVGRTDRDFKQPLVAVVNTWSEVCPGHFHLKQVVEAVKAGIWQSGATPLEFGAISQCATTVLGESQMRYDLPAREVLAFDIETIVETQMVDAMVILAVCDKTVPAALLAAARLDIPTIIVPGGPMLVGTLNGKPIALSDLDEKVFGALPVGKITEEEIIAMEDAVCPSSGACAILGTANTMQCIVEAVGMALPYSGTALAVSAERLRLAKDAGNQIVELIRENIKPSDIMTTAALHNMLKVLMTMGGSTNAVLHVLALAQELGLGDEITLDTVHQTSVETPCLADITPTGQYYLTDFHLAGGVPAIMDAIKEKLNLSCITVSGGTMEEFIKLNKTRRKETSLVVIRDKNNPVNDTGGLAVLRGNLAPRGSVVRRLNNTIPRHVGTARIFESQEEAMQAIGQGVLQNGDVVVVRDSGPQGAPGMPDIYAVLAAIVGRGLEEKVAVVTDGRFSGFARGLGVCQVSPESAVGGPLAVLQNGDKITIDLDKRELSVDLSDQEIASRLANWERKAKKAKGILGLFAKNAEPAYKGARLV